MFGYSKAQLYGAAALGVVSGVGLALGTVVVTNKVATGQWLPSPLLVAAQGKVVRERKSGDVANVAALYGAMTEEERGQFDDWLASRSLVAIVGTRSRPPETASA